VPPATIAEYQLAVTRRLFDERPAPVGVGYEQALANLERSGFATRAADLEPAAAASALPDMPDSSPDRIAGREPSAPTRTRKQTVQGTKGDRSPSRRRDVA
jgi:hypothetical protein